MNINEYQWLSKNINLSKCLICNWRGWNMFHKCRYCYYESPYKPNLKRHMKNKHGNHLNSVQPLAASNPHPYVHPYLNNNNQQSNPYPQCTPEMVANNTYYARETRAPTKNVLVQMYKGHLQLFLSHPKQYKICLLYTSPSPRD